MLAFQEGHFRRDILVMAPGLVPYFEVAHAPYAKPAITECLWALQISRCVRLHQSGALPGLHCFLVTWCKGLQLMRPLCFRTDPCYKIMRLR